MIEPPRIPSTGRVFERSRALRLGDAGPDGALRLDSVARYLGDVAEDDVDDAGLDDGAAWLVRRTVWWIRALPLLGERVSLTTWCSGTGPRWAERATVISRPEGDPAVWTRTLWVAVDTDGRPRALSDRFLALYGPSAESHRLSARLTHPPPPPDAPRGAWTLRRADLDVNGHVNNAVHWAVLEEHLVAHGNLRIPLRAELEYREGIRPGQPLELSSSEAEAGDGDQLWFHQVDRLVAWAAVRGWSAS